MVGAIVMIPALAALIVRPQLKEKETAWTSTPTALRT